ncbi:MAG TPA: hypothetical protein VE987_12180, partial [Polyangiaceae bacterium]|nr:hypothetical protein [Polyangiaceae bacterium]
MSRSRVLVFSPILGIAFLAAGCRSRADASASTSAVPAKVTGGTQGTPTEGKKQYFPLQSYRVGPYAAGGSGFFGGFIDYMQLVNIRDGGINGVKLTWSECETEYVVERGVECYERLKGGLNGAPVA